MAITDKWQRMLSSFADIKQAIIDMGGAVSGGYATYAKGVRSIYSTDSYTPQYVYPAKTSNLFEYIQNQMTFCAAVKEEIRQAIIDGGVACDTTVPLSQYGDKIRQISTAEPLEIVAPNPSATFYLYVGPNNYQCEAKGGKPPYTWAWSGKPGELTMSSSGLITGIATNTGLYEYCYYTVTDSEGTTVTQKIKTQVTMPAVYMVVSPKRISANIGDTVNIQLQVEGGVAPYTFTYEYNSSGLDISTDGLITGEVILEKTALTHNVPIIVTDSIGKSVKQTIPIALYR